MKPRCPIIVLVIVLLAAGPGRAERLAVKVPRANVRNGPGNEHVVIRQAGRYYPVEVLERRGRWLHVRHGDGQSGWIAGFLVW